MLQVGIARTGYKPVIRGMLLVAVAMLAASANAAADPVFDVEKLASTPLESQTLNARTLKGLVVEEVRFHSHMDGEKRVDIFGLLVYPPDAKNAPALIWNQGGLARASLHWPTDAARRGYVALCIDFPLPNYRSTGGYPIVSSLDLPDDPRKAPIYHGAVALIKAVSFLQSRPEVDKDRIGMSGLSWGGFYSTLMAGVDPRIKAASAMFGCGELQLGNLWWDGGGWNEKLDANFRARWRESLDPAPRLANRPNTPVYWLTGTNDQFYWLPSVIKTYEGAAGTKGLSLWPNYQHALPAGPADTGLYAWLDVHLKGAAAFPQVSSVKVEKATDGKPQATWTFKSPRAVTKADLILSYGDAGNWVGRYWKTLPATIDGEACRADLPAKSPMPYFISGTVISEDGQRHSTPVLRVDPAEHGMLDAAAPMDYDGCAEWGGFEPQHLAYFANHGYFKPESSPDAKSGAQSARIRPGQATLRGVLGAAGVPHRLSFATKSTDSARPVQVEVQVGDAKTTVTAGADWSVGEMTVTPPKALSGGLSLVLSLPKDAPDVLLDDVRFEPTRR